MGWITEDGVHEGYLVPQFADGQRGTGTISGSVDSMRIIIGGPSAGSRDDLEFPTRPAGEVTGWVVCCDCTGGSSQRSQQTWTGPVFTRVPSKALEDLDSLRVFAPDEQVGSAADREDVEEAARALWRAEHTIGADALSEVTAATEAVTASRRRLDAAVARARRAGASWEKIGRAAGMSRQAAQERWHKAGDSRS